MALFKQVVDAFIASREWDRATLGRLEWWVEQFGPLELAGITPEEVDAAMTRLASRGIKGATLNRYASQLGSVFKYARRSRLVPRAFVPPTKGIERAPEPADPERYLRPEEVARILASARIHDRVWRKMPALVTVAYHTGLRVGALLGARWRDVDFEAGTLTIAKTKNGDPHTAALTPAAIEELRRLPKGEAGALVFGNRSGGAFSYRPLWAKVTKEAGLAGRNFHQLRHGHGYALAKAGTSQTLIMQSMGHRTLSASARYAHASVEDKRAVVVRVFA